MVRSDPPSPGSEHGAGRHHDGEHHYGGEHHRLSLIDRLGERVEHELDTTPSTRDPELIGRLLPLLDVTLAYFAAEVRGFDRIPDEQVLVIGNHSGGIYMPDYWAFLREWVRHRGVASPLYSLGFDFLFSIPGFGPIARRIGAVPGSQANADRLLSEGASLLVYPGGDKDNYRPWSQRHRVELHGHTGFVRLALRRGVPVVPMVSHGSHNVFVVLSRGEALARRLGIDRLNINILPVVAGPPWGISTVAPPWPLPAKVTVQICEPLDWSGLGPAAADDPVIVRRCYDETVERMQAALDELVVEVPHPVLARLLNPLNRGR